MLENFIIENDFGVDFISQTEGTKHFVGLKNLCYHIVVQSKENEYFNLRQAHIHRFEVAKLVSMFVTESKKSHVESEIKTLSNGAKVEISLDEANVELKLRLSDEDYFLPFLFLSAPHYKILTDEIINGE